MSEDQAKKNYTKEELTEEEMKGASGGKRARCPGAADLIRGDLGMPAARPADNLE